MCKKYIYTEDTTLRHCGKLTQWILGIPGRGLNMDSPKVKIKVSGYIEMSEENLDNILAYDDPHQGLVYSIHMGYCDASNLQFIDPRD
jgi:hypothetical protein